MENLTIKKKEKLFMGFALGGELCWLGRMLLIFPFALHSWQKYFVSQWPCTNGQAKISRILRTSIQLTHLTTPPPNTNLALNKQEPQGGGVGLEDKKRKNDDKNTRLLN